MKPTASILAILVYSFLGATVEGTKLIRTYKGNSFFSGFNYETTADPTHGFVNYVDQSTAKQNNLTQVRNGVVYIRADHSNVASSSGRLSIRLSSKDTYTTGLFIADLNHMPTGCGTWPAFWTCGSNWPNNGEIDIIEGVNNQKTNSMTLHTSNGCTMQGVSRHQKGSVNSPNCWVGAPNQASNQGCGVQDPSSSSYGSGFNSNNGGVYATWWKNSGISIYFFERSQIPKDIKSGNPNPKQWGTPAANFPFTSCTPNHFQQHRIILDLTFCGDWAGSVFSSQCPGKGSCNSYVQNNPGAFKEAYWAINHISVYKA